MKPPFKQLRWSLLLLACLPMTARAEASLMDIYRQALASEPNYASAVAARDSSQELPVQARADLLPSVGMRVETGREHDKNDGANFHFNPKNWTVNAAIPIVRVDRLQLYRSAEKRAEIGDFLLLTARHDLIVRVVEAYFNALFSFDTLELVRAQKQAIAEQREQSKTLYASGVGTVTEVNESQARYELTLAQEFQAINDVDQRMRELRRLTGEIPDDIRPLNEKFPVELPTPASVEEWYAVAHENNPNLRARLASKDAADYELKARRAEHLPSVDLVMSRSRGYEPNYFLTDQTVDKVMLQMSIPLFQGFRTSSRVTQGVAELERSARDEEAAKRDVEVKINQAFLDIQSSVSKIKALESAVKSSELSLEGARVGQEIGYRTNVDVLNAQQQLYTARRDLQQERYRYVMGQFRLKAAAGIVTVEDVQAADTWLQPHGSGQVPKAAAKTAPVPEVTAAPEAAPVPEAIVAPEATATPETTATPVPEATAAPEVEAIPEVTAVAEAATAAEAIAVPEAIAAPAETAVTEAATAPEVAADPEAAVAAEVTAAPEETVVPEAIAAPAETAVPDAATAPEVAADPEVTAATEVTATPAATAVPEAATAPEATAAPEVVAAADQH